jgi:hypothetical protein
MTRTLSHTVSTSTPAQLDQDVRAVLVAALDEFQAADPSSFVLLPLTQGVTNIRA